MNPVRRLATREFLLSALVAVLSIGASAVDIAAALEIGDKAPDFTLPSTSGGTISLSQYVGKHIVLIEFYGIDFSPT